MAPVEERVTHARHTLASARVNAPAASVNAAPAAPVGAHRRASTKAAASMASAARPATL